MAQPPPFVTLMSEYVADGHSPSNASFSWSQSTTLRGWYVSNPADPTGTLQGSQTWQATDRQQAIKAILGATDYGVNPANQVSLARTLPLADPEFPWLYATEIQSLKGLGTFTEQPAQLNTNDSTFPGFTQWNQYECIVSCQNRPYPVSPDSAITTGSVVWYDTAGNKQTTSYSPEWLRFTDFDIQPQDNWLEQQRGASYFQTASNAEPGANAQATSQQSVRMYMPDSLFKMMWVNVPLRYILSTNSYLNKFRGRINQNAINYCLGPVINNPLGPNIPAGTAGYFAPGTLLYMGYKPRIYTSVLPITNNLFGTFLDYSRFCDLEIYFTLTTRAGTDLPAQPANKNIVVGGWNTLPYLPLRQFFYAYNLDLAGNKNPLFYSMPAELLFSDPDGANAYQGTG